MTPEMSKDQDLLTAIAAGSALLAQADGADGSAVRARMVEMIGAAERQSGIDIDETAIFDHFVGRLETDETVGADEALAAVRQVKGSVDKAKAVMQACCTLAGAEGDLSPAQAATARRICEALNLSPTQFGF